MALSVRLWCALAAPSIGQTQKVPRLRRLREGG